MFYAQIMAANFMHYSFFNNLGFGPLSLSTKGGSAEFHRK